jgi:predicted nucleotidyltransferase
MDSLEKAKRLRDLIATWARETAEAIGADGIYLFGSLVYRDGAQFVPSSDVDLAVVFPAGATSAVARKFWLEQLLEHKIGLEKQLAIVLNQSDHSEPMCSVIVLTHPEIGADIHKDGAEGFLANNRFMNLLDGSVTDRFPDAGQLPINDRLIRQCLRFAQKKRNAFLVVAADGKEVIEPFAGVDPIPKDVMRHAAMAARLRNPSAAVGAEYDTQAGLDFLTNYLYDTRGRDAAYGALHHWVSVRRGARGAVGSLTPSDDLLLAEIIADLAHEAHEARKAQEATRRAAQEDRLPGGHSTIFFEERFAQAFPGVRGISWFDDPKEIETRLLKLLEEPLRFSDNVPMWWWRGFGNLHIELFKSQGDGLFLMNVEELKVRRIAAVNLGSYYQCFVYVETDPMPATRLYAKSDEEKAEELDLNGYCHEEYGLLNDGRMVKRAEYDDGAALIDGELLDIRGKNELRVRYTTSYNFIIAAHGSSINNNKFDARLTELLNALLRGDDRLEELAIEIRHLPKRHW